MNQLISFFFLAAGTLCFANDAEPVRLDVSTGSISFAVDTNVPGVDVKGKSNNLTAHVLVAPTPQGLVLQQIEAVIPVRNLSTGMKLRDEHMQKYIFKTADGQLPDLVFAADAGVCKPAAANRDFTCQVPGMLTLRGAPHPVTVIVVAREEASKGFHATLDTTIRLTDFNIEPPSQLGVKTSNDVKVHLEFMAKQKPVTVAAAGDAR